jgi:hypothetical protein
MACMSAFTGHDRSGPQSAVSDQASVVAADPAERWASWRSQ